MRGTRPSCASRLPLALAECTPKCYTIAHMTRNIVCNTDDVKTIRCKAHDPDVTKHDQIQQIRINFMMQQREAFILEENTAKPKERGLVWSSHHSNSS